MHKETTNDELAEIINKGFQNTQDQFHVLEKKFDALSNRFDGLDNKFGGMERKIDKIDGRLNTLVNVLEKKQVITEEDKQVIHG